MRKVETYFDLGVFNQGSPNEINIEMRYLNCSLGKNLQIF